MKGKDSMMKILYSQDPLCLYFMIFNDPILSFISGIYTAFDSTLLKFYQLTLSLYYYTSLMGSQCKIVKFYSMFILRLVFMVGNLMNLFNLCIDRDGRINSFLVQNCQLIGVIEVKSSGKYLLIFVSNYSLLKSLIN